MLHVAVYMREILGRGLSKVLNVMDLAILEGSFLSLYNLALVLVEEFIAQLVEEVGLMSLVEVHVEVRELVLIEKVVHLHQHIIFGLYK